MSAVWKDRPLERTWLLEDVLRRPLIEQALGGQWLAETRRAVEAGEDRGLQLAMAAAGPAALEDALSELTHP